LSGARVVLWRHGRTAFNVEQRFQGRSEISLDDVGVRQVGQAAKAIARLQPTVIVTSPLLRARQTADALAEIVGVQPLSDPRFAERSYGNWEGLTRSEIVARWPDDFEAWKRGDDPSVESGVEPRAEAARRASQGIEEYFHDMGDGTLVVVSHGGTISACVCALLGQDAAHWHGVRGMENAHWTVMRHNDGRVPPWRIVTYNTGYGHFE
jgi:probable phosphoglycerate mutase